MVDTDTDGGERRVLVLNPKSGSGDHVDRVAELAGDYGFDVRTTEQEGHAQKLAEEAADEVDFVAAAGGDGTINEVVNGLVSADALEETTLGVVPAGTGNNFASNVGIGGIEHAFEVMESGARRALDVGITNERTFVNSCVSGVTAEASGSTTPSGKSQFGVLAYVVSTLETVTDFDPLSLCVEMGGEDQDPWEGEAVFVLVGNCRRFTTARRAQANVEDGLFEVTIVEQAPTTNLVSDATLEGVFGRDAEHIVRRRTPSLTVEQRDGDPVEYSLDGEMLTADQLSMQTRETVLTVAVGEGYQPDPDSDSDSGLLSNAGADSDSNSNSDSGLFSSSELNAESGLRSRLGSDSESDADPDLDADPDPDSSPAEREANDSY